MREPVYPRVSAAVMECDSPLGRWWAARWEPQADSPLYPFVNAIWYFDGATAQSRERVFPDGLAELIVQFDDAYRDGDNGSAVFPSLCVNGIRTRPSVVEAPGKRCRVLGIRFTAIGACTVLGQPVRELLDVTVDLRACIGSSADELATRCVDAAALASHSAGAARAVAAAVVDAAAWWTAERLNAGHTPDRLVRWVAARIGDAGGVLSIDALRTETGAGRADFARRFRQAIGVTPKRYARILRFHRSLGLLAAGKALADVAHELRYFDQSHMYRDFAEFGAMTPAAFVAATKFENSVHLSEP